MRNLDIGGDTSLFTVTSEQTNTLLVPFYFDAAPDALTDAGAVTVTNYYTSLTTTTASAVTLADGLVKGQLKKIQMIVDVGDATLTIASPVSAATNVITFADAGDYANLIWNGTAWRILEVGNDADGATAPVIS
jgi:hypothetical protein